MTKVLPPNGGTPEEVATAVNAALKGNLNSTDSVTLSASVASTTVLDHRVGTNTKVFLSPQTANASAEMGNGTIYIDPADYVLKTSYKIRHANNAQTDRTYSTVLLG